MAREKKITVKPFLNKSLKSRQLDLDSGKMYPLYFQVIYDKRTTRFQAGNNWFAESQENDLKRNPVIVSTCNAIKKIIRYEAERLDDFVIKGIGERVKSYLTVMTDAAYLSLSEEIEELLKGELTVSTFEKWKSEGLTDRVERGMLILGGNTPDTVARLFLLTTLMLDFKPDGVSVFSWLLTKERDNLIQLIQAEEKLRKGQNLMVITKNGSRFEYPYPLRTSSTVEGFDVMAHQIIDNGIHFVPDFKSVSYNSEEGIFSFALKK